MRIRRNPPAFAGRSRQPGLQNQETTVRMVIRTAMRTAGRVIALWGQGHEGVAEIPLVAVGGLLGRSGWTHVLRIQPTRRFGRPRRAVPCASHLRSPSNGTHQRAVHCLRPRVSAYHSARQRRTNGHRTERAARSGRRAVRHGAARPGRAPAPVVHPSAEHRPPNLMQAAVPAHGAGEGRAPRAPLAGLRVRIVWRIH